MLVGIPQDQVRAGRNVIRGGGLAKSTTKLRSNIKIIVDVVVAKLERNIGGWHLGTPDLWGCRDSVRSDRSGG